MPTYDYRCKNCGHTLEIFHGMTENPRRRCPLCGESKLEKLIGPGGGFIFKGSGFYITDYRSKEYKEKVKAESKETREGTPASKPPDNVGTSS